MSYSIGMIVGSLRKESYNRKVAEAMAGMLPAEFTTRFIEIGKLALYNEDLDSNPPAEWTSFRAEVKALDGVMFFTPEYNRSIPAVLKNALDVASRPYGASVWGGKPACVVSVSIGAIGGFGANHHMRQVLSFLNMPCMQQPEAYVGSVAGSIENGTFKDNTKAFFKQIVDAYAQWFKKVK